MWKSDDAREPETSTSMDALETWKIHKNTCYLLVD